MSRQQHNAYNSAQNGVAAAGMVTSLASVAGKNVPSHVQNYASGFADTTGFGWPARFYGMLFAGALFFIGLPYLIYYFGQDHQWVAALAIPGVLVWSSGAFAFSIAVVFSLSTYTAMKLKCRLYLVDDPDPTYGLSVTGNPLMDAIFITPFRLALLLLMIPFLIVGSIFEILRVIALNIAGKKNISYRGDQGKYYDKVRRHYAQVYSSSGAVAAKEYLRMAYSGMLTPLGKEIPSSLWTYAHIQDWLAPMIQRHGPIDKYRH